VAHSVQSKSKNCKREAPVQSMPIIDIKYCAQIFRIGFGGGPRALKF